MRLVMAAACVLALPLWRRTSRVEVAAVGVMSLFLGAVEFSKGLVSQLRVNFGSMYLGFKAHSGAASTAISQAESSRAADGVTWAGIVVNILLASFKFFAGIYGHSAAMVADAGHSLSDLMSDGVTLWAVRMSRLPPDADHPYGHGRFEALGALIVSGMLLMAGYGIGNHSWETLGRALAAMSSSTGEVSAMLPTKITMVAALVSIILKEALYRVTAAVGMKYNSQVLIANAWHHRSDAISSVVALLAIVGARVGLPILDPIAGLLVAGMVSLTGLQVCQDSVRQLTDTMDYDIQDQVFDALTEGGGVEGVLGFDSIRARQMGPQTLVDLTIQCDYTISASAAQKVRRRNEGWPDDPPSD
jgi:cation diffusion facilitator family transporter